MSRKSTTIGVPRALRERFEALKKSESYKSFSYFCYLAIVQKIENLEDEERTNKKKA